MRGPAITGTCRAGEVFDGQRWLSQAPGHGDLLRSTSDVQVCPYVPAVAGLRSRDTYGYLCTFACTWHCTWICTPTRGHGRRPAYPAVLVSAPCGRSAFVGISMPASSWSSRGTGERGSMAARARRDCSQRAWRASLSSARMASETWV